MAGSPLVSNNFTSNNPDIRPLSTEKDTTVNGAAVSAQAQHVVIDIGDGTTSSPVTALNPLPISGSFSASLASSSTASEGVVSVNNTAGGTQILAANANRKDGEVRVHVNADQGVYIARDSSADANSRYYAPGERLQLASGAAKYTGPVFAYVPSGSVQVEFTEL